MLKLQEAEERLDKAITEAPYPIIMYTSDGQVLKVNNAFMEITGYSYEDVADLDRWLTLAHGKDAAKVRMAIKGVFSEMQSNGTVRGKSGEYPIYIKDGSIRIWEFSAAYLGRLPDGRDYIMSIASDMTERKMAEDILVKQKEELIKANELAKESEKLKTDFLAQMSHEIRTPINTILNYFYLIREEVQSYIDEELRYSFSAIENSSRRLIRTIDLILNMSQVQGGHVDVHFRENDIVKDVLFPVIQDNEQQAKSKGLKLELDVKTSQPVITYDHYTTSQIFSNIIDNAIKYTQIGVVTVSVYRDENNKLCVDIKDTGIGMSEEFKANLFKPFRQEEMGYTRRFDGNGLGLALVKKYCEINDAEIKVCSEKEKGSIFTVEFRRS